MAISRFSILLLTAFTIAAQTAAAQSRSIDDLKAQAKQQKVDKEIMIGYDKFKDRGAISTKPFTVSMSGGFFKAMSSIGVTATHMFPGPKLESAPETFTLIITSGTNGLGDQSRDRNAYFLIDGRRLELKPKDRSDYSSGQFYIEAWQYTITRDDLESMSKAKLVEMRLGNSTEQTLKQELLDRFSKFLRFVDPQ